jgi:hypothetical protein
VCFSTGAEISLALKWSIMCKKVGRWFESRTSETVISDRPFYEQKYRVFNHSVSVYSE